MVPVHPAEANHRLSLFQAEERRLATALSAVRSGLNELAPVSSLPTEVLEEIFAICVSWLYGHKKPNYRLAWTQVCSAWRHISLDSARLWRCIDLCDSRLAHEFLIRSRTAPISIVSASPLVLYTENLQSHAGRLQAIDVFLFPDDMIKLFTSIGPNLSNLTDLSLKIPSTTTNLVLDIPVVHVRRLLLDCIAVPWDMCRSLTFLSLRGLSAEFSPSISQVLAIFESSSQLEYVRLENIDPVLSDEPLPTRTRALPCLREMIISAKAPVIFSILSGISIPHHARLQLNCPRFADLYALLPTKPSYRVGVSEINTLRLARHAVNFLRPSRGAEAWPEDSPESILSISSPSSISIPILSTIRSQLDMSHIIALELKTGVLLEIPPQLLVNLLTQTTNLESLRVMYNDLKALLHALTALDSTSQMLCPHLANISFSKPGNVWWHFSEQWVEPVLACVKMRHKNSVSLQRLEFKQCHGVDSKIVERFEGTVREVLVIEHTGTARRHLHG